jgi:hypothetical protein
MRELLSRSYEILGVDQKIWLSLESGGYGDSATGGLIPDETGAVEHITADVKFDIPREDSAARSGRSLVTRLSGKIMVEFSFESYIIPGTPDGSGNPTLPPIHAFLLSAFGDVDVSNPAEIKYELSRLNDKSFRIIEEATHYSRLTTGCVIDTVTFSLPGDGKATFKAEGFAQDSLIAGEANLDQAISGIEQLAQLIEQDLTFDALAASGKNGNLINIQYLAGGTAGAEVVTVVGNTIQVQIDDGVSDADDVKLAIDSFPAAAALISVLVSGAGANPQSIMIAAAFLTGGLGVNDLKVGLGEGNRFEIGALIDIILGTDGNTIIEQAREVSDVSEASSPNADIISVSGAALSAASIGDFVAGHAPENYAPIDSSQALLGLKGTFTVAGFTIDECELISAEIALANNYTKKDFLYGTNKICGYIPDKRRAVTVKLDVLLNKNNFSFYMRNKKFVAEDLTITLEPNDIPAPSFNSSVGRTFEFRMPKVEFNIPPIENPSDSYVTLSLEGVCMAIDSNNLDSKIVLTIK